MLDLKDLQPTEQEIDYKSIYKDSFIDVNETIEHPPIAISKGFDYNNNPIPLVTYGNFLAINGPSKSFKSFLKTALISCYIGGQAQTYFSDIVGHDTKGKYIIDADTEQAKYHVHRAANRVVSMVGSNKQNYKPFQLRPQSPDDRVKFIEWLLYDSEWANKIGLLCIDGAADLITNVNDLEQSNMIAQKFMKWTSETKCALITVIHKNYESNKPTGHLGSAITKKAETVISISKTDNVATAHPQYTRNLPFDEFCYSINENGLPYSTTEKANFI
jgi:hypothetical protein